MSRQARYQSVRGIDDLPLTANGKIDRPVLQRSLEAPG
jgi:acyl-coenzyme A synthetase/AMP-(fatty) acid ligase